VLISEIEADDFVYIVTQTIANNDYQVQKIEIEAPEENALQSVTFESGMQSSIDKAINFGDSIEPLETDNNEPMPSADISDSKMHCKV
jgi:hypothetical protein